MQSFQDFVMRKEIQNEENWHYNNEPNTNNPNVYYCLMGAEDRWRWEVCHCEHCEKNEWTIINH